MPRQRTLVYGGKLLFSNAAENSQGHISETTVGHDGFSFLNDEDLDKCLSKKKIRLTTPALWLSSPHWAKCMTNSYPSRSPSKRHAKPLHSYVGAPSRACTEIWEFLRLLTVDLISVPRRTNWQNEYEYEYNVVGRVKLAAPRHSQSGSRGHSADQPYSACLQAHSRSLRVPFTAEFAPFFHSRKVNS